MEKKKTPFDCIALLLQGGGALGAYQAGVYQALSESGLEPDWVAGISIGAINAALIAGNAPGQRVQKLREFWESITIDSLPYVPLPFKRQLSRNSTEHQVLNLASAWRSLTLGISGFFTPRFPVPWLDPQGTLAATSFYDTAPLKSTLEKLIDFDRINHDDMRITVGAVNVTSGNFTDFDNKEIKITPEHVMASGALPPGFPPIQIGKEYYWDGGLVSNTPLQWMLEGKLDSDTLIFQIDLWSADGEFPQNMADVLTRHKDIQYSSRTRANTDRFRERHRLSHAIATVLEKMPEEIRQSPAGKLLTDHADSNVFNIVHLIYHNKAYEGYSKDFEFSRLSMKAHWRSGYEDTMNTLRHPEVLRKPESREGVAIYDFSREGKLQKEAWEESKPDRKAKAS